MMRVQIEDLGDARPERGSVVTIGAFDGVHIGHQALIAATKEQAGRLNASSAVVTFDRHPASIVRPQSAPKLLTDLDQKIELLGALGLDYTLVLKFDEARAAEPAEEFVHDILLNRLNARSIVIGHDFHFGKGRAGNVDLLRSMGAAFGFDVQEVRPVTLDGGVISSTAIRSVLARGYVEAAANLLGRPHEIRGLVVMGDGRGRELGFPTANVTVADDIAIPADGVYAGEYELPNGSSRLTAISVGTRPTFYEDGANLVEAYLLDFDGDLYGQHARIKFLRRIRGQVKFESMDDLIGQMRSDVEAVRAGA
jgi:riboflavin kinase / FMN adenylyltransferase